MRRVIDGRLGEYRVHQIPAEALPSPAFFHHDAFHQ